MPDLGADRTFIYAYDADKGTLSRHGSVPAAKGAGPRHFAFGRDGRTAYVINELGSTISVFRYDAEHGELHLVQEISTLPSDFHGTSGTAEVCVHPSGKFLYGSNRGHNSIAIFSVDSKTGRLKDAGHEPTQGKTPRHFAIDPSGEWLLAENQDSNNIVIFRIDEKTGALTPTRQIVEVGAPVCLVFLQP